MQFEATHLSDVKMLTPPRFGDDRGYFSEAFNAQRFLESGFDYDFVQDNESVSRYAGTVRGLHYQAPPFAQAKLVRVVSGSILDVAVDVRVGSPEYGKWVSVELSACNGRQLLVPRGFLHGFVTLAPETHLIYKVDNFYNAEADGAVIWNDPDLAIDWTVSGDAVALSTKDAAAQSFADWTSPFAYEGAL
ncbi:dTDP-4-dehydrorhamnose 3,5-epimerase [Planktomarina temperata]|nr:dTDP-4-dehydrorhamnose 3,5-epimerase [Planktomarina temperata]